MFESLQNPTVIGFITASLIGSFAYLFRELPKTIVYLFQRYCTSSAVIYDDDAGFSEIKEWLSSHSYTVKAKHSSISAIGDWFENQSMLIPGPGWHILKHNRKLFFIYRFVERNVNAYKKFETLKIITIGFNNKHIVNLLSDFAINDGKNKNSICVYVYNTYWKNISKKSKRPVDSIVLVNNQAEKIIDDIKFFTKSKQWYYDRGISYKRGYLFKGPPGTGKTSFIMAIAGYLNRPIYVLMLNSLENDSDLTNAISSVPSDAVLLIEDADAATSVGNSRTDDDKEDHNITLSGLLTALDGTFSHDGRLLFLTTNHPEKLDEALIRPGRIDVQEYFGYHSKEEALLLAKKFLPLNKAIEFSESITEPTSPASLQEKLIRYEVENAKINM